MNSNHPIRIQARNDIADYHAAKAEQAKSHSEKGYEWWVTHGRMSPEPVWPSNKPKPTEKQN